MNAPKLRILSLGAGVQSTTIALLSAEGRLPKLDAAIFADTGWEPAAVYEHLDRLEQDVLKPAGIPLYRVDNGNLRDDVLNPNRMRNIPAYTASAEYEKRDPTAFKECDCGWVDFDVRDFYGGELPEGMELPDDCAKCGNEGVIVTRWGPTYKTRDLGMLNRRCTQLYKLNPVLGQTRLLLGAKVGEAKPCRFCQGKGERYAPWRVKLGEFEMATCSVCDGEGILSRIGQPPAGAWAEQWIGFSTDEVTRVSNRGDTRYSKSRYPLLELEMSRTQCDTYLAHHGWGSVAKSACIGCPFHGNAAWRQMRDTDPASFADAVAFDKEYRHGAGMRQERFLHISRKPLDLAPIDKVRPIEWQQTSVFDAAYDAELAEEGDPDGCSPWACRSGQPITEGDEAA